MKNTENQFYKNLALAYVILVFFAANLYSDTMNSFATGLNIALGFFVYFQLELGRISFNKMVLALFVGKGFFMDIALQSFKYGSFNSIEDFGSFASRTTKPIYKLFGFNAIPGPEYFVYGLIFITPLIYILLNMNYWQKRDRITESRQSNFYEWIPFIAVAAIFGILKYNNLNIGRTFGIMNFNIVTDLILNSRLEFPHTFELDASLLIMVIILLVLFLMRKSIDFGIYILAFCILQIIFFFAQYISFGLMGVNTNPNLLDLLPNGYLLLLILIPVLGLIGYVYEFRLTTAFISAIHFAPFGKTNDSNSENSIEETETVSFEKFQEDNNHFLVRESNPIVLCVALYGMTLLIGSFLEDFEFVPLIFGLAYLIFPTILFFAIRTTEHTNVQLSIYGIMTGLILQLLSSFALISIDVMNNRGTLMILFFLLALVIIYGINIIKALQDDIYFVKFIANRNNTRIFNLPLNVVFENNEPNNRALDTYSKSLSPWNKRKHFVNFMLGLEAFSFSFSLSIMIIFASEGNFPGFMGVFGILCFTIVMLSLYSALIRWQLIGNMNFCVTMIIIFGIQLLSASYSIYVSKLTFLNGFAFSLVFIHLIVYLIQILLILETKNKLLQNQDENSQILDTNILNN